MLFGTRARNVFGRNTNLYAMAAQRTAVANPPQAPQYYPHFRAPRRSTGLIDPTWASLQWVWIASVGPNQDLDVVENNASNAGIDRYVVLDPLEWVTPGDPAPTTTGWMYVVGSTAPPKHVRQVASQSIDGVVVAPFFSRGKFVDIAVVTDGLGVASNPTPLLPAVQRMRTPIRRSIGAPRTGLVLAAAGVPGENCWWTGYPDYAKCCTYDGIAIPFCVTYPDVE